MAKKKTKEELEAEAKAEEERLAAEAKAEEERRAAAAAEAARKEAERIRLRNEEIDRITSEMNDISKQRNHRKEQTGQQLTDTAVTEAWHRYLQYHQSIDISDERSIQTFISLLHDTLENEHTAKKEKDCILPPSSIATNTSTNNSSLKRAPLTSNNNTSSNSLNVIGITNDPPNSPLTPGLVLCSRLASVIQALENRLADNLENTTNTTTSNESIYTLLSTLKRLTIQRMDGLTQQLLDNGQDYGIDVKDGLREISISDSFRIRSTAEELPRKGLDVTVRHQHFNQTDELGGELLLWANLPPGKIMRTKQITNGINGLASSSNNRLGITVEMHKAIASGNTALRALWTAYDDANEIDIVQKEFEAMIEADSEGIVSRDPAERRKPSNGGKGGRPKSSSNGKGSRPASATVESEESKGDEGTNAPSAIESTDATATTESKEGEGVSTEATPAPATTDGEATAPTESKTDESTEGKTETTDESSSSSLTDEAKNSNESSSSSSSLSISKSSESSADTKLIPTVYPIGGTIHIELLAMPPTMGFVKGWAMSKPNPGAGPIFGKVRRLPHPAIHQGVASAAAQAVKVRVQVPSTVIVPSDVAVAHWQSTDDDDSPSSSSNVKGHWTTKDIADISFDPATRYLTFSTVFMKAHALCRPPHTDLPYRSWRLVPVHESVSSTEYQINYILDTPRFPITISVTSKGCTLSGPTNIPELTDLIHSTAPMRPGRFLTELKRRGIDLLPSDTSVPLINAPRVGPNKKVLGPGINLRPKVNPFEEITYTNIAEIASAFELGVSEWNMHTSVGSNDIVVRARERIRADGTATPLNGSAAWQNDPTVWRMVRFTADNQVPGGLRVLLVTDKENEARGKDVLVPPPAPSPAPVPGPDGTVPESVVPLVEIDTTPKYEHVSVNFTGDLEPGAMSHSTAKLAIEPRTSVTARKEIDNTSPLLCSMVEHLLRLTRPLSFTYIDLETPKQ